MGDIFHISKQNWGRPLFILITLFKRNNQDPFFICPYTLFLLLLSRKLIKERGIIRQSFLSFKHTLKAYLFWNFSWKKRSVSSSWQSTNLRVGSHFHEKNLHMREISANVFLFKPWAGKGAHSITCLNRLSPMSSIFEVVLVKCQSDSLMGGCLDQW